MRSFLASLVLFSLMLGAIFLNSRYLLQLSREMQDAAEAIPSLSEKDAEQLMILERLDTLECIWEKNRETVALTVSQRTVEGIDDCLGTLDAAIRHGDAFEFDRTRAHLLRIINDLGYYDVIQLGSVL